MYTCVHVFKCIMQLYIICAAGGIGWNEYPTLKAMMVMVMTNDYTFPVSLAESQNELLTSQEEQVRERGEGERRKKR